MKRTCAVDFRGRVSDFPMPHPQQFASERSPERLFTCLRLWIAIFNARLIANG
jgi:hypothetical protein